MDTVLLLNYTIGREVGRKLEKAQKQKKCCFSRGCVAFGHRTSVPPILEFLGLVEGFPIR